jgi:hypothetical protein
MTVKNYGLIGVGPVIELGKGGAKLKNSAGILEARNNADTTYAVLRAADPVGEQDVVTKRFFERNAHLTVVGQIDGNTPPAVVNGAIFICTTAGGLFAEGALYRGEGGSWIAIPLFDGMRISVADALTGGAIEFLGDHIYIYDEDTTAWNDVGPAPAETKNVKTQRALLQFSTSSPLNIGSALPANAVVRRVIVNVTVAFDGTAPTLEVGDAGDTDRHMLAAEVDLKTVGKYEISQYHLYGSSTQVIGTYAADSSTAGQADIMVEYSIA